MSKRRQARAVSEAGSLNDDSWVWGVIFATAALTALCVATVFSVASG
jgi:hypothetical protein